MSDMSNVLHFPTVEHAITWADQARAYRNVISAEIERLIGLLDEFDGDVDTEDGDEDRCAAFDDDPKAAANWLHGPGDAEDAEDDDPLEVAALEDVRAVMEPSRDWGHAWNASTRGEDMEDSHDREDCLD
jgi:hypothetical protein